ncbi:sigma-70 family RNA polymerase sigma factor [Merismopedia glauca]|uniref:Group 3/4 sigma-70 RNA polymerase sigma factor n=1 Tax=Merismopedia glauca CCAP 1448/3 TaxID=1296344 RepID=A0A2T1C1U7_9CYAN|nr:sigma-70 family RNA polymerase sigma factor [Merismopedia glauca]PSB02250.1 group 3/4 sigma-70 RNA polymerase sigma factor [Merismopedia glauca CCAP 1448/3]
MRVRQNIVDIFSSFLQFEADRFSTWLSDPKLRRSMEKLLVNPSEAGNSANFWAMYWYKAWKLAANLPLPKAHLIAYLQEPCYWSAYKTTHNFTSNQYSVSDCFQLGIAQTDKILKGFNPERGAVLKNYASAIFSSLIRESLRQQGIIDICSPWALLRKISQKGLTQSLMAAGLSYPTISYYLLAWNCYKSVYTPTAPNATRKLDTPSKEVWEAVASAYRSQNHTLPHPTSPNAETLEKWLLNCAKAARSYFYPTPTSINMPTPGHETGEMIDTLAVSESTSLLGELIKEEETQARQTQQHQLREILVAAIASLSPDSRQILSMYYAQGLTQQQMAETLQTKQYTVSRRLSKAKEQLLLTLAKWSQNTLHISLTSDVLKDSTALLEEWLTTYYATPQAAP